METVTIIEAVAGCGTGQMVKVRNSEGETCMAIIADFLHEGQLDAVWPDGTSLDGWVRPVGVWE